MVGDDKRGSEAEGQAITIIDTALGRVCLSKEEEEGYGDGNDINCCFHLPTL